MAWRESCRDDRDLDDATKKSKRELTAEERAAEELVARAREQGLSLTGPDGLLDQLTKTVLDAALNQELTEHLGHEKHTPADNETGNIRNGIRSKTVLSEGSGQVAIEVPHDRDGTFEPHIQLRDRSLYRPTCLSCGNVPEFSHWAILQHLRKPLPLAGACSMSF